MQLSSLLKLSAALAAASAMPAWADFSGPLAPAQWTLATSGPTFGSGVDLSAAPGAITLLGGDDATGGGCPDGTLPGFVGGCQVSFTLSRAGDYSFDWSYATADTSPQYDAFGMLVDGVRIELVANGGDVVQSGSRLVHANSSFGWYINCTDCTSGAASATLSNVVAVPEPSTSGLLALGLVLVGGLAARRRCVAA